MNTQWLSSIKVLVLALNTLLDAKGSSVLLKEFHSHALSFEEFLCNADILIF